MTSVKTLAVVVALAVMPLSAMATIEEDCTSQSFTAITVFGETISEAEKAARAEYVQKCIADAATRAKRRAIEFELKEWSLGPNSQADLQMKFTCDSEKKSCHKQLPFGQDDSAFMYLEHDSSWSITKIQVMFKAEGFQEVADAVMAKYGRPSEVKKDTYQNAYGAKFVGTTYIWAKKDQVLMCSQYGGGDRNSSLCAIAGPQTIKRDVEERAKRAIQNKGSI